MVCCTNLHTVVPIIWDVEHLQEHLENKYYVVYYHPTPPPGREWEDQFWKSLPEIEETVFQLLQALELVHEQGWIWLGTKLEHIWHNQHKVNPRDPTLPLRIIGFESSMQVGRENKATLPLHLETGSNSLQRNAPVWRPGAEIGTQNKEGGKLACFTSFVNHLIS